jgi:hypothetical protein
VVVKASAEPTATGGMDMKGRYMWKASGRCGMVELVKQAPPPSVSLPYPGAPRPSFEGGRVLAVSEAQQVGDDIRGLQPLVPTAELRAFPTDKRYCPCAFEWRSGGRRDSSDAISCTHRRDLTAMRDPKSKACCYEQQSSKRYIFLLL